MKKVLFILAFVAVYGVSMAMTTSTQVTSAEQAVTIVADVDDLVNAPEVEKEEGKKEAKAKSATKAKGEGCAETKAKAEGCSGEKTAKKDCSSSCSGKKK